MDRLTYRPEAPYTNGKGERIEAYSDYTAREIINCLAAYEDTGLTPEEVTALKEATTDAWLQLRTATFSTDKGAADLANFILSYLPEAPKEEDHAAG